MRHRAGRAAVVAGGWHHNVSVPPDTDRPDRIPTFGDEVVIVAAGIADLYVGDRGEVVGLSDDRQYVAVMIDRIGFVYTVAVGDVEVQLKPAE